MECSVLACDEFCQKNFGTENPEVAYIPDQQAVCWWHETSGNGTSSKITFGSVSAIAYGHEGQLIKQDIGIIYTGL